MERKYEEVIESRSKEHYSLDANSTPLTLRVREAPLPRNFPMTQLKAYDGTTDPFDHLHSFVTMIDLLAVKDEILCRAFATTLDDSARKWYNPLLTPSSRSVASFAATSRVAARSIRHQPPSCR